LEVAGDLAFPDIFVLGIILQGDGKEDGFSILEELISVDPAFSCVLIIVAYHKSFDGLDKLEVAYIWEYIGLHYRRFHWFALMMLMIRCSS
jgi:hypothetical protein